jgi:hypothetical protein
MSRTFRTVLTLALATGALGYGCGSDDGETPDCPPLRLYDVRSAQSVDAARAEMKAAAAKGCITLPVGFDSDSGSAGAGGGP